MLVDRVFEATRDRPHGDLMKIVRGEPVDGMPHHIDQLDFGQGDAEHTLERVRMSRQLGVVGT